MNRDKLDLLIELLSANERANLREAGGAWSPAVDIYESDKEFVVEAELPDVGEKDLSITLKENTLIIAGERKPAGAMRYHRVERVYGPFRRSFALPANVLENKIRADLKDGILKIIIPKEKSAPSASSASSKIEIT